MDISRQQRQEIEEMMPNIRCDKQFDCYRSEFGRLGPVRITAGGKLIECQSAGRQLCAFAIPFGKFAFCTCPLRGYIARNFGQ